MRIGEIIRERRKNLQLTQEDIANFLGVSTPAVNKWENNISCPDITLLAPLARLLKTDVDTLLSFHEDLTEKEIVQIVEPMVGDIDRTGYEQAFEKYQKIIHRYSGCIRLIYNVAVVLNMYLPLQDEVVREKYTRQIDAWMELVADSKEPVLADGAAGLVCNRAIQNGNFEKAQRIIDRIPEPGIDKRLLRINLYQAQHQDEKVCEICEGMIYQDASNLVAKVEQLIEMKCQKESYEEAAELMELVRLLVERFELNEYLAQLCVFQVACHQKDRKKALEALEGVVRGLNQEPDPNQKSCLYQYCEFNRKKNGEAFRMMFKQLCERSEELDFLREESEFARICSGI